MTQRTRDLIDRYYQSLARRDWAAFGALLHPDFVYELPQTRERIRSRSGYVDYNQTYPGSWTMTPELVVAEDRAAVAKIVFQIQGDEPEPGIQFYEVTDGLISRITDWYPDVYDPKPRECGYIERY